MKDTMKSPALTQMLWSSTEQAPKKLSSLLVIVPPLIFGTMFPDTFLYSANRLACEVG